MHISLTILARGNTLEEFEALLRKYLGQASKSYHLIVFIPDNPERYAALAHSLGFARPMTLVSEKWNATTLAAAIENESSHVVLFDNQKVSFRTPSFLDSLLANWASSDVDLVHCSSIAPRLGSDFRPMMPELHSRSIAESFLLEAEVVPIAADGVWNKLVSLELLKNVCAHLGQGGEPSPLTDFFLNLAILRYATSYKSLEYPVFTYSDHRQPSDLFLEEGREVLLAWEYAPALWPKENPAILEAVRGVFAKRCATAVGRGLIALDTSGEDAAMALLSFFGGDTMLLTRLLALALATNTQKRSRSKDAVYP